MIYLYKLLLASEGVATSQDAYRLEIVHMRLYTHCACMQLVYKFDHANAVTQHRYGVYESTQ